MHTLASVVSRGSPYCMEYQSMGSEFKLVVLNTFLILFLFKFMAVLDEESFIHRESEQQWCGGVLLLTITVKEGVNIH